MSSVFRSQDNVLIELSFSAAYDIVDIPKFCLIGDVFLTTMADWIKNQISKKVAVEEHRRVFNVAPQILSEVVGESSAFFKEKGIDITALQLTSIKCSNPDIQGVLDNYVKETTDRTNAMLKEKAESELALERVQREIRVESETRKLVEIRQQNLVREALARAEANVTEQKLMFQIIKDFAGARSPEVYGAMAEVQKAEKLGAKITNAFLTPDNLMLKVKVGQLPGQVSEEKEKK
eukprot:ANDGO_02723.mRNA.1 hypothetical protein